MASQDSDVESDHFEDAVEDLSGQGDCLTENNELVNNKQIKEESEIQNTEGHSVRCVGLEADMSDSRLNENDNSMDTQSRLNMHRDQSSGLSSNDADFIDTKQPTKSDLNVLLEQDSDSQSSESHSETEDSEAISEAPNVSCKSENVCNKSDESTSKSQLKTEELSGFPTEEIEPEKGDGQENDNIVIDEEAIKQKEALLSEEEREERRQNAQHLKEEGNTEFKNAEYESAIDKFTAALAICPMCYAKERSIMYSNRGACKFRMEKYETCIEDCSKALELNPRYLKALLRRAECYEKTEKLDEALEDYTKALGMDPSLHRVREACMRLPEQIKERNEKMKEEMLGKLKDLGNMVLRPFGLSTNNFQLNQDPNTGSYSVNFVQKPDNGNNK